MSKNRKRLAKLLVPMLALSAINTNAVGNVKVRSTSFSKKRSNMRGEILNEDKAKKRENRAYVIQYSGPALNDFLRDFEFGADSLKPTGRIFGGNAGIVTKCRGKKDGKIYAVKCEPNPTTTGITTQNNATLHANDNANETQFYEDVEKWWKDKKWAVKCHGKYNDGHVSYTVTDWVEGITLNQWISQLPLTEPGIKKLSQMFKQYNEIIDDLSAHNKINDGMHEDNIMVVKDKTNECGFQLKLVDNGRYQTEEYESEREKRNARQIRRILNHQNLQQCWHGLWYGHGYDVSPGLRLNEALDCINAKYDSGEIIGRSGSYGAEKRKKLPDRLDNLSWYVK